MILATDLMAGSRLQAAEDAGPRAGQSDSSLVADHNRESSTCNKHSIEDKQPKPILTSRPSSNQPKQANQRQHQLPPPPPPPPPPLQSNWTISKREIETQEASEQTSRLKSCKLMRKGQLSRSQTEMSQTLQSIQSLSMQLNRAASLSGSQQLDCSTDQLAGGQRADYAAHDQSQPDGKLFVGRKLTRLVGKKAARVKELVLQNLGRAERTKDELFKIYEENFYKQQANAVKLQKELKSYIASLKSSQEAGKTLNECIQLSTSDYQSARHDLVCESLTQLEHLEADLMEKLREQVLTSVSEYLGQFGEIRDKIAKRHRKLIDFDSSRRLYELTLASVNKRRLQQHQVDMADPMGTQLATSQLVDEARLLKLREQYNYCRLMYENLNGELHEQLPMIYEKKMKSMLMTLQSYFAIEAQFHLNAGKLFASASDVIDELPTGIQELASQQQQQQQQQQQDQQPEFMMHRKASEQDIDHHNPYHRRHNPHNNLFSQTVSQQHNSSDSQRSHSSDSLSHCPSDAMAPEVEPASGQFGKLASGAGSGSSGMGSGHESPAEGSSSGSFDVQLTHPPSAHEAHEQGAGCCESLLAVGEVQSVGVGSTGNGAPAAEGKELATRELAAELVAVGAAEAYGIISGLQETSESRTATTEQLEALSEPEKVDQPDKPRHLYKVKTIFKYLAEDVDELCFEADEVIQVIEIDENQDQEEGWLMGIREVNGQRGLFPANFTCPF